MGDGLKFLALLVVYTGIAFIYGFFVKGLTVDEFKADLDSFLRLTPPSTPNQRENRPGAAAR